MTRFLAFLCFALSSIVLLLSQPDLSCSFNTQKAEPQASGGFLATPALIYNTKMMLFRIDIFNFDLLQLTLQWGQMLFPLNTLAYKLHNR